MKQPMSQLEFFLALVLAAMLDTLLSYAMWYGMASTSVYGTERAHSIIKTFPLLFAGAAFLAWYTRFVRKRRIAARLYFGLAAFVPIWGWIAVTQMWDVIRKIQ